MNETTIIEIGMTLLGALFNLVWALLRQKDAAQSAQIADLYAKHEIDAAELVKLKVKVAAVIHKESDEQ
jgi:hypothetical protein